MSNSTIRELKRLRKRIDNEQGISYAEIFFIQEHKKEIFDMEDIVLAQWAGIPEEEWNSRVFE